MSIEWRQGKLGQWTKEIDERLNNLGEIHVKYALLALSSRNLI